VPGPNRLRDRREDSWCPDGLWRRLDFTDAGPVAKDGLRRQVRDLYTEKLKKDMAQ